MSADSFFHFSSSEPFRFLSASHLIAVGILVCLILILFVSRSLIQRQPYLKKMIRYTLLTLLILSEISLELWYVQQGIWNPARHLPLELCSITLLLSIIMLITRSRALYSILFFAGIVGALLAILTPNLGYGFPHFRFIQFFMAHYAIILAALYMTWIESYRPQWRSIGYTMLALNVIALAVGLINYLIGSNYMFLMRKPSTPSVLDWFGPHPTYLIVEELFALLIFTGMYVIFFYLPDLRRRKTASRQQKEA